MRAIDVISIKRDGKQLSSSQISWFIKAYTVGDIPDYQAAALLMAIYLQGMSREETVALTLAMAESGDQLDPHAITPFTVDKHSSGGVGDKTTLVVEPLVAACGVPVGKMSGRGLGSSGGTLDKMESFRGWSPYMSTEQFMHQLRTVGIVLAGQSADIVPADGKLYALRDVTGTVASTPLIAASIMSKKLATGADAILLDVKVGSGALMGTVNEARQLAEIMVAIGQDAGREMMALLSNMDQPLGWAIGNALEVKEALATLRGSGPEDFWTHCLEVAGHMLRMVGKAATLEEARELASDARDSGQALAMFRAMLVAQGGDSAQIDDPNELPRAEVVERVESPRDGYLAAMDTGAIGWASVHLGAGRLVKSEPIDHSVGFVMPVKVGQSVLRGDLVATIHANDPQRVAVARQEILAALSWSDEPVDSLPQFYGLIA